MTNEAPAAEAPADPAQAPAETAPPAAAEGQAPESLLAGVTVEGDPAQAPPAATAEDGSWLPEKHRVMAEDGTVDEAASARKLADAYRHLEARLGSGDVPPKSVEDYALQVEGLDAEQLDAFKADPMFQDFAKAMHAEGLTNKQLNAVVARYLKAAPELLAADQALSANDAKAELAKVWPDEGTMQQNLAGVVRAINAFGAEADEVPGSRARLMEKYGTDPDFIAFAASIAGELREDQMPSSTSVPAEVDIEALMRSEAYFNADHPEHERVKAQVTAWHAKKYGNRPAR